MSALRPIAQTSRGFTLIELMVVISLLGVFTIAVYEAVIIGLRAANSADEREDIRLQMARGLDLLTREASAAYSVDDSDANRFQFDARIVDADSDGDTENLTNINYRISSGDLQRVQGGNTVTLVPDCTSATPFTYLDSSNASTTTEAAVRVVQVSLTATQGGETITMSTAIKLRNL